MTTDGTGYCWGFNDYGPLGDGTTTQRHSPTAVSGGHTFVMVDAGYNHTCGVTEASIAYCWGFNASGELGDETTTTRLVPTSTYFIDSDTTVTFVVDPSLTFTVSAHTGVCNDTATTTSGASASGSAVALGRISSSANGIAVQGLDIATNAANGWDIYARSTGALSMDGHSFADAPGTWSEPAAFPPVGTEAFGYHASDMFGSTNWAAFTTDNKVVWDYATPGNGYVCIAYQAGVGPTTPAGTYSTTVIYTAVARY